MKVPRSSPALLAARRARWLAEVATALDYANSAALRLAVHAQDGREALLLSAEIDVLRNEIASIRLGRPHSIGKINPDRVK